mmetsp:Transcript_38666/g.70391  ORF Transcript_38666/g.70391 Transcript_38666/m.70391 type:complete len:241 (+) Transcript_38666:723-1445(+)
MRHVRAKWPRSVHATMTKSSQWHRSLHCRSDRCLDQTTNTIQAQHDRRSSLPSGDILCRHRCIGDDVAEPQHLLHCSQSGCPRLRSAIRVSCRHLRPIMRSPLQSRHHNHQVPSKSQCLYEPSCPSRCKQLQGGYPNGHGPTIWRQSARATRTQCLESSDCTTLRCRQPPIATLRLGHPATCSKLCSRPVVRKASWVKQTRISAAKAPAEVAHSTSSQQLYELGVLATLQPDCCSYHWRL